MQREPDRVEMVHVETMATALNTNVDSGVEVNTVTQNSTGTADQIDASDPPNPEGHDRAVLDQPGPVISEEPALQVYVAAEAAHGIREDYELQRVDQVEGGNVRYHFDGRKLYVISEGVVDIQYEKGKLREVRKMLSNMEMCASCLSRRRAFVNYPCMCFCYCQECVYQICYMCGMRVESTIHCYLP